MNKRLRLRHPNPLPARNQSDIYSVCFQQESQVNKVLLLCRSMPVALLGSLRFIPMRSMRPHTPHAAPCGQMSPPPLAVISQLGRPIGLYWPANWRY
jgi:hypothetical protein